MIIVIDFDGVLHSYTSGWISADIVLDDPVPGAIDWLLDLLAKQSVEVNILSSRSNQEGGIEAMKHWLKLNLIKFFQEAGGNSLERANQALSRISFPLHKPPAHLTIDDRAICFGGTFPTWEEIRTFKPWNKK